MPHKCGPDCPFRREKKGHTKKGKVTEVTRWHKKQKQDVITKEHQHKEQIKKAALKEASRKRHSPAAADVAPEQPPKPVANSPTPAAKRALDMNSVAHNGMPAQQPQGFY